MAKTSDWLPGVRMLILAMCRNWLVYMTAALRAAWGVPDHEFTELETLFLAAEAILQKAQDKAERTHVITLECQKAFKALIVKMRYFRNRYFKIPPLSEGDWIALGFKTKDLPLTAIPAPDGMPEVSLGYSSTPHALTARMRPMAGTRTIISRSYYGYAVYVGIMPPGGATLQQAASEKHYLMKPPVDGKGLIQYRFIYRQKEKLVFDAEDTGMIAYVCCRYEDGKGKIGRWGPVAAAIIP